jgi:hypothetical protein
MSFDATVWYPEIEDFSFPSILLPLTSDDISALKTPSKSCTMLGQKIKQALRVFPYHSFFARLSSCAASEGVECHDVYDILDTLRASPRIQASLGKYIDVHLFIREGIEIDHSREFRLFIYKV